MNRTLQVVLLSTILLTAFSCRKNRLDPYTGGQGPSYFPLKIGHSWTYAVDSIKYNEKFGRDNDTFHYQVRNVIESEFVDNEGMINQSFTRYLSSDTSNWRVNGSFAVRMSAQNVVLNRHNAKKIILKFPIQEFDFWDGNSLNSSPLTEFEYLNVHVPRLVNGQMYDSTCAVVQENVLNRVQTFYEEHVYASNFGPIESKLIRIDEKDIDTEKPVNGFEVHYQLIAFDPK